MSLRCCLLYEACIDEWFIHWLLILFVCPYVGVYYTRPVLTSGSFIDFWSCLFVLTLLSIMRGLYWRVVHSLTSDPVCLYLRCCLLYEACVDEWFIHWLLITGLTKIPWIQHISKGEIINGQFVDTFNIGHTRRRQKAKTQHRGLTTRIPAENHGLNQVFAKLWFLFSPAAKCSTC